MKSGKMSIVVLLDLSAAAQPQTGLDFLAQCLTGLNLI